MPNKKDLEQQFGISDNTVYKTLKACGLETSKEDYSDEEIENHFKVAREMISNGKRYKDVEQHFGINNNDAQAEQAEQQQEQSASNPSAADAVGVATAEMAVDMVTDAVKQVAPHIPNLIAHTLAQEMRSDEMKSAFNNMRAEVREKSTSNAGVDFLLQKMNGAKQLTGDNQEKQLLEASPVESKEN
ncbi:MAG: hypothetical protein QNJ34_11040 [Xenococcaceae cyanobacterium MO_188.B29]|nr:hypothetical protein [Xenococcaceae cyanobacterium MO_188.B29]